MWLQRLLKFNNYGTGRGGGSGGAGSDMGGPSEFVLGLPGQGAMFQAEPDREDEVLYNKRRRRQQRMKDRRRRRWRLSRDQQ